MLQAGGGACEATLPTTISELDPARWLEEQMVDLEQYYKGGQHQHEIYPQLPGEDGQQ